MATTGFKGRILVGQTLFEGNSFNPTKTTLENFQLLRGEELLRVARSTDTSLGGVVRKLEELRYEVVPALAAIARPGGPIEKKVYDAIVGELVEFARKGGFDAICLPLHGACVAEDEDDTEGQLIEQIRQIVGGEMPIAIALDLHGHITERMMANATIMTGYRTNPHSDMAETGERAAVYLDRIMEGSLRPRGTYTRIPYLTRGGDESTAEPLISLNALARKWMNHPDIIDVSIFNILPFINAKDTGQVLLVYDQGQGTARVAAREIADALWEARDKFTESLPSVEETLSEMTSGTLLILGDNGDSVVSGAPGDSLEIARAAMARFSNLRIAVPVYDPEALRQASAAGVGAEITFSIGGGFSPNLEPMKGNWQVERIGPSAYKNSGTYARGAKNDFGKAIVLKDGNLRVVVTERAPAVVDPAFYEAVGIPISTQDAIVAKSANHYKLAFAGIGRTVTVDTPGLSAFRLHELPFTKPRPIYPLDDVTWNFDNMTRTFP